jgi:hypothetical protein
MGRKDTPIAELTLLDTLARNAQGVLPRRSRVRAERG